jgi:hypothetical protein
LIQGVPNSDFIRYIIEKYREVDFNGFEQWHKIEVPVDSTYPLLFLIFASKCDTK